MTGSGWDSGSCSSEDEWARFVRELGEAPQMVERLLAVHVADASGLCTACTTPGRGTGSLLWPCSLHQLAGAARAHRLTRRDVPPAE
ncbi:MAG: hypothetical protein LH603_09665 [Pseudonocardia sp.]|nr:hypothetical protein [Pseudonocardia sp.]